MGEHNEDMEQSDEDMGENDENNEDPYAPRDPEVVDQEYKHRHQLAKYEDEDLWKIAEKGDKGEPLTEEEREKWAEADEDTDGNRGNIGEPSTENLQDAVNYSTHVLEEINGDTSDGDTSDGDNSDGDNSDGDNWDGDTSDGYNDIDESFLPIFTGFPLLSILLFCIRNISIFTFFINDLNYYINKATNSIKNSIITNCSAINNLLTIVIPHILVILNQIKFLLKAPDISVYKFKSINNTFLYSNINPSLTSILYKLTINCKPESLSFTEGKAVLMLPPLKPFLRLIEDDQNEIFSREVNKAVKNVKFMHEAIGIAMEKYLSRFYEDFYKVVKQLDKVEQGFYVIELYYYLSGCLTKHESLCPVYNFDPFDKMSLNLLIGNYGYTIFKNIPLTLPDEIEEDILLLHVNLLSGIVSRLHELLNNPELKKDSFDFNKDTLVVIFKTTKEAYEERKGVKFNEKISIPGIDLGLTKHY